MIYLPLRPEYQRLSRPEPGNPHSHLSLSVFSAVVRLKTIESETQRHVALFPAAICRSFGSAVTHRTRPYPWPASHLILGQQSTGPELRRSNFRREFMASSNLSIVLP